MIFLEMSNTTSAFITGLIHIPHYWAAIVNKMSAHWTDMFFFNLENLSPLNFFYFLISCIVLYFGYKIFFVPINRRRLNEDIGYVPQAGFSKKDVANIIRQRRKVGDIPPVFPNGWYGLTESFNVKTGSATSISCLGETLAVFRDASGKVHVLDAYCPHMGANLGVGGRIVGDCIECPFHGWRYRGEDGKCVHIPNCEKIPEIAKVKSWNVAELNGWIYLWFHAEGAEPMWEVPEIEDITSGSWQYKGRAEHYISCHIQEIPENGADVLHLKQVHAPFIGAGVDLKEMYSWLWSFAEHEWHAQWEQLDEPNKHIGLMHLKHRVRLLGKELPAIDLNVKAFQIGPALVHLHFESLLGNGVFQMSVLPVEPLLQKTVFNIHCPWTIPVFVAKIFQTGESMMVERDIMIWNNKRYIYKPLFSRNKEDALILRHRRWYSQFYTENSPRLNFKKESADW